jgi:hypothetical protein
MADVFSTRENRLSDGSVIHEVWQRGSDQRLAGASTDMEATLLADRLNTVIDSWLIRTVENSVDC